MLGLYVITIVLLLCIIISAIESVNNSIKAQTKNISQVQELLQKINKKL